MRRLIYLCAFSHIRIRGLVNVQVFPLLQFPTMRTIILYGLLVVAMAAQITQAVDMLNHIRSDQDHCPQKAWSQAILPAAFGQFVATTNLNRHVSLREQDYFANFAFLATAITLGLQRQQQSKRKHTFQVAASRDPSTVAFGHPAAIVV